MPTYTTYAVPRLDLGVPFMEYANGNDNFIASQVLPVVKSNVKAGTFPKILREYLTSTETLQRASKAAYQRTGFAAEDDTFACKEYGLEMLIGDDERQIYANDFDCGKIAVEKIARDLLATREKRVSAAVFNTTTWDTGTSSLYTDISTTWATIASSTPIGDVSAAKILSQGLTGVEPDTLILNDLNLSYLLQSTQIVGRMSSVITATGASIRTALAEILGLKKIIVGNGVYNSSKEGQTASMTKIWSDDYAMVCKTPDNDSLSSPCIGRTFLFAPDSQEVTVETYRSNEQRGEVFRARQYLDEVVIDASFGHLLKVS